MSEEVTNLLLAWGRGNEAARDQLIPHVYNELRRIAAHYLRNERRNHTLQTSALVNEAYLRLVDQNAPWQSRAQFFGIAARLMRQILVDQARTRLRLKRGGDQAQVSLAEAAHLAEGKSADLLALDDALQALAAVDPRQSRIVELRFFAGLTIEEAAEVTGLSTASIEREWRAARAWLRAQLSKQ
jgi:RNA polymerase sigma factor (TIGR02999 family)